MTDKHRKYLIDVLMAIEKIEIFTEETISFFDYDSDYKVQSAVERQLGITGEALNKYSKLGDDLPKIESSIKIIGLRNRLIHAYDSIDNTIIWAILKRHIEPLKTEVMALLEIKV